jgi:hypothetical protein
MTILYCNTENVFYIYTCPKFYTKNTHMFIKTNLLELNFHWILNPEILNFPCERVKISTKRMIKIKIYRHFLTLGKEQHSTFGNLQEILFVYTSSVYFLDFIYWVLKCATIFVNYTLYIIMVTLGGTLSEKKY